MWFIICYFSLHAVFDQDFAREYECRFPPSSPRDVNVHCLEIASDMIDYNYISSTLIIEKQVSPRKPNLFLKHISKKNSIISGEVCSFHIL